MTENDAIKALEAIRARTEGDFEKQRCDADDVLNTYLKRHGLDRLADAWEQATGNWYA